MADLLDELDTVVTGVDVIRDISLWIVSEGEPIQDVGDKLEVWITEVLNGDVPVISERSEDLSEVAQLTVGHTSKILNGLCISNLNL